MAETTNKIAKDIESRLNVFCCIESPTTEECAEIITEVRNAITEISTQAQLDIIRDVQLEFKEKTGQGHQFLVGRMIKLQIKLEEI